MPHPPDQKGQPPQQPGKDQTHNSVTPPQSWMPENWKPEYKKMPVDQKKHTGKTTASFTAALSKTFVTTMQRAQNSDAIADGEISPRAFYNAFGQMFYHVGYQAEYTFLRVYRAAVYSIRWIFVRVLWMLGAMAAMLRPVLAAIWQDFAAPWRRLRSGFANIRALVQKEKQKGGAKGAAGEGLRYFWRGVKLYRGLIARGLMYLLPLGAAAVFLITVHTVLNYTYALRVEVGGQIMGFVASETVYEDAQALARGRIKTQDESQQEQWDLTPTYSVQPVDKAALSDKSAMADKLIASSDGQIEDATGILVDNALIGAATDGKALTEALEAIKGAYLDPENPNVRAEFIRDVASIPGKYFTDTIYSVDELMTMLTGQAEGQQPYYAVEGETPMAIAARSGLTLAQFYELNPQLGAQDTVLKEGDKVVITKAENYLRVKTVETIVYQQAIPYQTQVQYAPELEWGEIVIQQDGVDGLEEITKEITRIDGNIILENVINQQIFAQPVDKIQLTGTHNEYGTDTGEPGTGDLIWPVPNYRGVSRGMGYGHRGLDIRAERGTPILAADNGLVTVAELGHWSYGNFVKIDHGNGITTLYAHCVALAEGITQGSYVRQGDVIAYVGSTGVSTGNHCHFETTLDGTVINPYTFVTAPPLE